MIQPVAHDWRQMIIDLEASGMSLYKVGIAIGLQYNQVKAIRDEGRIPKHNTGELLRLFHMERTNIQVQT